MGRGREWELSERNDSRNHSRKYSRELLRVSLSWNAFPLNSSEISDKSETGREKHFSVPAES